MLLAAAAALLGASVQSATGFGFALVLSPALFAAVEPREAVATLLALSVVLNVLVLADGRGSGEGRAPMRPIARALAPLLIAAAPGLAAGLLVLDVLSKPWLQLVVGAAVIVAALVQARSGRRPPEGREPSLGSAYAAGLAAGTLTTSTSVNGPPIVLWLQARGTPPMGFRSSLALSFLFLNLAGGLLIVAERGTGALQAETVLPLLALVALGYAAGARVFRRLDAQRLRVVVLTLVLASGAASGAAGLAGLS